MCGATAQKTARMLLLFEKSTMLMSGPSEPPAGPKGRELADALRREAPGRAELRAADEARWPCGSRAFDAPAKRTRPCIMRIARSCVQHKPQKAA